MSEMLAANPGVFLAIAAAILFSIGALLTVGVVVTTAPRRRLRKRMLTLGLTGQSHTRERRTDAAHHRQKRIQERLQELEDTKRKKSRRNAFKNDLVQAGLEWDYLKFLAGIIVFGVAVAIIFVLYGAPWFVCVLMGFFAGFGVPQLVLKIMAKQRVSKFTKEFANAIDVLVRGVRSGLPVGECLAIIGRELPEPVGEEFRLLVEGQKLGMSLEDMMRRGMERFPTAEYRFFAIVLQIQSQTGGNLAETLSGLSNVLRERKKLRDKIKALSSEAKASAMIIGSLPFAVAIMVYILNPDYIMKLFTTTSGNYVLGGSLFWMLIGIGVMAKMINFKV